MPQQVFKGLLLYSVHTFKIFGDVHLFSEISLNLQDGLAPCLVRKVMVPRKMNPNDFGCPPGFPLAPPAG